MNNIFNKASEVVENMSCLDHHWLGEDQDQDGDGVSEWAGTTEWQTVERTE